MKNLYIIGAGGFGREVAWLVERINLIKETWSICGFVDDDAALHGKNVNGYFVLGDCDYLKIQNDDYWVVCAVGSATARKKIIEKIKNYQHIHFPTLIDPNVRISTHVEVGDGTIICVGSIITVNMKIGRYNIINLDCTIGHDVVLNDYVTLYPSVNVSGTISVGECTELGTGVNIIQGRTIGKNTIIGAGTVVVRDIPSNVTAVGNPAKIIKYHAESSSRCLGGYQLFRKFDKFAISYGCRTA